MGYGTGVLGRNRGEFGGLGGHVAQDRPRLAPGLVDHILELADPALAELSGSRRLVSAGTLATRARLLGARLFGARLFGARLLGARLFGARLLGARLLGARTRLIFRSHLITSNWGENSLPLVNWRG
jgi:hypothetical protein